MSTGGRRGRSEGRDQRNSPGKSNIREDAIYPGPRALASGPSAPRAPLPLAPFLRALSDPSPTPREPPRQPPTTPGRRFRPFNRPARGCWTLLNFRAYPRRISRQTFSPLAFKFSNDLLMPTATASMPLSTFFYPLPLYRRLVEYSSVCPREIYFVLRRVFIFHSYRREFLRRFVPSFILAELTTCAAI